MSDEQLHSLDEQKLVSEWKEDGRIISPEDQVETLNNLEAVRQDAIQGVESFNQLPRQTDEETAEQNRAKLAQEIADEDMTND